MAVNVMGSTGASIASDGVVNENVVPVVAASVAAPFLGVQKGT